MTILIFAGPTIASHEIQRHLDAIVLPPPVQGELLTALETYRPQAIGILDTSFPRSAWISEVHYALRSGVAVYGASGQGALRAVELKDFGMKGYGVVFNAFASGEKSADDAVLCTYSEKNGQFEKTSISLFIIEATLEAALDKQLINESEHEILSQKVNTLHWQQRTWETIFNDTILSSREKTEKVYTWVLNNSVDVQKNDAIEMLLAMAADSNTIENNVYCPANRFGMLNQMYSRERRASREHGSVPLFSVAHFAAVNHARPLEVNFDGMNREIVAFFAKRLEFEITEEELAYEWTVFKHERSLSDQDLPQWRDDNDMTPEGMDEFINTNALCRKMHQWMNIKKRLAKLTGPFLDQLRLRGEYPRYADASAKVESYKTAHTEKYEDSFTEYNFEELLVKKSKTKPLSWPLPLNQSSRVMGVTKDELFCELRRQTFSEEQAVSDILATLYDEK